MDVLKGEAYRAFGRCFNSGYHERPSPISEALRTCGVSRRSVARLRSTVAANLLSDAHFSRASVASTSGTEAAEPLDGSRAAKPGRTPAPFVLQTALANFAVTYELNVYCADASRMLEVYADLHRQILDVFNEYGVQIMTPAYMADPPIHKVVPPDQWHTAPADGTDARNPGAIAAGARPRAVGS